MASNNKLTYNVDLVFCIDCTESMDNILNIVKTKALNFYADVKSSMELKGKSIDQLRVRLVAFRDYLAYDEEKRKHTHCNEPMLVTDFFSLPQEAKKLEVCVKSLKPVGGGDEPEDGLEALAYAIRSEWTTTGVKDRHVIVLWSDQKPHELGFAKNASKYPYGMAYNFGELTEWWGDNYDCGYMPEQAAKRLILFTPDEGMWSRISETWDNVVHLPSKAGDHLQDVDYQTILSCISQTIA